MKTKDEIRKDIDAVDGEIARLLQKRFALTDEIGKLKGNCGQSVTDASREKVVTNRLKNILAENTGSALDCEKEVLSIYKKIFSLSKNRQRIFSKKFALVGGNLSHSYSKPLHELFGYKYELLETDEKNFENVLRSDEFDGFNVTVPFKRLAASVCDSLDEIASLTGTVNTVKKINGKLYGYNTDFFGMKYALEKAGIEIKGRNVLILGTGGTAHTAKILCEKLGAKSVEFVGRKSEINYSNCYERQQTQVIINATPVGMYPDCDGEPIDVKRFLNLESVFDAVYNPYKTKLVLSAKKVGKKAVGGLEMLVAQAVGSAEIFLGRKISHDKINMFSSSLKLKNLNIVFAGMPGAGKSTLAKDFSEKVCLKFFDTDLEFEKKHGVSPAEFIENFGEKKFREEEKAVLFDILKSQQNVCIALGGGSISDDEIAFELCKKSIVVIVERDINKLSMEGRPLSSSTGDIAELYKKRMPIFRETGDLFIDNNGSVEEATGRLLEAFE